MATQPLAKPLTQRRISIRLDSILLYMGIFLASMVVILPITWGFLASLKTDLELTSYPVHVFPAIPQWENYEQALTLIPYWHHARISLFLAAGSSTIIVLTSALVGFGFARLEAPGRRIFFGIVVGLLMIPYIVTMIPQYIMYSEIGLVNTYWPWVLGALGGSPFFIFLFRQFFATFPRELEEAAEVDGCSTFRIFWNIFLPNARPVMAVAFIINFSGVWNDWYMPLIYLTDNKKTTLAVKLATAYVDPQGNPLQTVTIAGTIIYALPLVVLFFLGQRHIMRGVLTSGLKG